MAWNEVFAAVLHMSIAAGVVIVAVLVLRLLLRRAPRAFSYALWGIVLFRLLCPVSVSSEISIFHLMSKIPAVQTVVLGAADDGGTDVSGNVAQNAAPVDVVADMTAGADGAAVSAVPAAGLETADALERAEVSETEKTDFFAFLPAVWLLGVCCMTAYSVFGIVRLKRKTACSMRLRDNIYLADGVRTPFVFGIFRPRIYLPSALSEEEMPYIILHEQHHIRRFDHLLKPLAFFALGLHWFNPLVWLAFFLAEKDMETSCDEAVLRNMGADIRWQYSASLLHLATGRRVFSELTPTFGEGNPKGRIRHVLGYKKPGRILSAAAVCVCVAAAACFLTNAPEVENAAVSDTEGTQTVLLTEGKNSRSTVRFATVDQTAAEEAFPEVKVGDGMRELLCATVAENSKLLDKSSLGNDAEGELFRYADFYTLKVNNPVDVSEPTDTFLYYGVAMLAECEINGDIVQTSMTGITPAVITFRATDGGYELTDYWEADRMQGDLKYRESVLQKITGRIGKSALNSDVYARVLNMRLYSAVAEQYGIDVYKEIAWALQFQPNDYGKTPDEVEPHFYRSHYDYTTLMNYGMYLNGYREIYADTLTDQQRAVLEEVCGMMFL